MNNNPFNSFISYVQAVKNILDRQLTEEQTKYVMTCYLKATSVEDCCAKLENNK